MSVHPHRQQFTDNIGEITNPALFGLPPRASERTIDDGQPSALAREIKAFNDQNDPSMAGRFIKTNLVVDNAGHDPEEKRREEINRNYRTSMAHVQQTNFDVAEVMRKIAIAPKDMGSALSNYREQLLARQEAAVRAASVSPDMVSIDPATNQPRTRAEQDLIDERMKTCSVKFVAEDLVPQADGNGYYQAAALEAVNDTHDRITQTDTLIEQTQNGEIEFADLPQEAQVVVLEALPAEQREELFKASNLSAREIEHVNGLMKAEQTGVLASLDNPQTAYGPAVINGGQVIGGQLSQDYLKAVTNTLSQGTAAILEQGVKAVFAPQNNISYSPAPQPF